MHQQIIHKTFYPLRSMLNSTFSFVFLFLGITVHAKPMTTAETLPSIFVEGILAPNQCPTKIWSTKNKIAMQTPSHTSSCQENAVYPSPIQFFDVTLQKVGSADVIRPTSTDHWSLWLVKDNQETQVVYRTSEGKKIRLWMRWNKDSMVAASVDSKITPMIKNGAFCSAQSQLGPKIRIEFLPKQKMKATITSSHCQGRGPCTADITPEDWYKEFLTEIKSVTLGTQTFLIPTSVKEQNRNFHRGPVEQDVASWKMWLITRSTADIGYIDQKGHSHPSVEQTTLWLETDVFTDAIPLTMCPTS